MARLKYWIWLSCVDNVRPLAKNMAIKAMDGPENLFFASREEIAAIPGVTPAEARNLGNKSLDKTEKVLSDCQEQGIEIRTLQDANYPERLRNIPDPPVVLYIKGRLPAVDDSLLIAVIGTRKASPYGVKMARKIGGELAAAGGVVVSGLARGCDAEAMDAALAAGGVSVGVLGTAIDRVYPAQNRWLFDEVKARGALVSEHGPGMVTYAGDFRARNRIIAGLSLGVVVIEAPRPSGTASTVQFALEQGRDVFAVPENADGASTGCNDLLADGAIVAACGADVMAQYETRPDLLRRERTETPIKPAGSAARRTTHIKKEIDKPQDIVYIDLTEALDKLPSAQRAVLTAMTAPDMHADDIIEATGMPAREVLAALTMLQMTGYVTQGAGRRYTRKL